MKFLSVFFILLFFNAKCFSQTVEDSSKILPGRKEVTMDPLLIQLMKKQEEINLHKQSMPGYRVQIFFGAQRQSAEKLREDFKEKYPDVASYFIFHPPNFKIRVGDFRTRLEAQKFLNTIRGQYSTSFVVTDEIKLPELK